MTGSTVRHDSQKPKEQMKSCIFHQHHISFRELQGPRKAPKSSQKAPQKAPQSPPQSPGTSLRRLLPCGAGPGMMRSLSYLLLSEPKWLSSGEADGGRRSYDLGEPDLKKKHVPKQTKKGNSQHFQAWDGHFGGRGGGGGGRTFETLPFPLRSILGLRVSPVGDLGVDVTSQPKRNTT